ncbi:MAG TPA: SURF1 family protein [Xanthomonadaceae bacterium]|nr:SURF1 family protein [Xanthomonadaceae bacterium]
MSRRRPLAAGWALALLVAVLFARLGVWQLDRMHRKEAMLAAAQSVLARRVPQPLALAADPAAARDYAWAAGDGRFPDLPAVLLDNQERDGRAGVRAYRVFAPEHAAPLLVELGWLPVPGDRRMPRVPVPAVRHVAGLLAPPPSAGLARPIAQPQPDGSLLLVALDLPLLRGALHLPALSPRVLKLDPALPPAYPRDLDILPNTLPPARHLGYAVQWFGLAFTVLAIALVLTLRKPKSSRRPAP